jgi:hypothetical protein
MESHATALEHTQVERVHPEQDAIERADGTLVGMVQVDPPSMALATDREWHQQAAAFQDFLNTTVDFPIQLYATTRPFPVDRYLSKYEDRLTDPDVKDNPQLATLIERYTEWYATELEERQMTIRDHYVVVPVTPREVRFERESLTQKLAKLPVLGPFVQVWLAPRIEEERAAMLDALDERLRLVARGLREVDGCVTRRVSSGDATRLVAEFWSGEAIEYEDISKVLRSEPVISAEGDRSDGRRRTGSTPPTTDGTDPSTASPDDGSESRRGMTGSSGTRASAAQTAGSGGED